MCGCPKTMTRACRVAAPCLLGGEGDVWGRERGEGGEGVKKGGQGGGVKGEREVLHVWTPQDDDQGPQEGCCTSLPPHCGPHPPTQDTPHNRLGSPHPPSFYFIVPSSPNRPRNQLRSNLQALFQGRPMVIAHMVPLQLRSLGRSLPLPSRPSKGPTTSCAATFRLCSRATRWSSPTWYLPCCACLWTLSSPTSTTAST